MPNKATSGVPSSLVSATHARSMIENKRSGPNYKNSHVKWDALNFLSFYKIGNILIDF